MLNSQQMAAVTYIDGPLLVLAGAGSGKTRVITQKIVHLIEQCGYAPSTICAVTFTNKAAHEMRSRVAQVLPSHRRRGLKMATFHTLGLRMIKKDAARCGLRAAFSIFDSDDSMQVLRRLLPPSQAVVREHLLFLQQQISQWKNALLAPNEISVDVNDNALVLQAAELYPRYQETLQTYNAVDFDDLIICREIVS